MNGTAIREVGIGTVFARALHAELIKVSSVRFAKSAAVLTALVTVVAALGIGLMVRNSVEQWGKGLGIMQPQFVLLGLLTAGAITMLVSAAWLVLGEFASNTAAQTFSATPNRAVVVLAKALLAGTMTALLSWVLIPLSFAVGESVFSGAPVFPHRLLADGGDLVLLRLPLTLACLAVAAVALAAAVRNVPVTVAAIVVWYAAAEDLVAGIPGIGPAVAPFLPVANGFHFAGIRDASGSILWSPAVSGAYVLALTVVLIAVACWRIEKSEIRT